MTSQFKKFLVGVASLGMGIVVYFILNVINDPNKAISGDFSFAGLGVMLVNFILAMASIIAFYHIIKKEYLDK